MYTKTCTYKNNLYKGALTLDAVHCHGVLIFKKGSMEVDSSIEALDLTLQRGATFSISEEASSFSYYDFQENHPYCHTDHGLLPTISPISRAIHLKEQYLLHHKVIDIYIYIVAITLPQSLFSRRGQITLAFKVAETD